MKLQKSTKILLGVATLWPFAYMILFFGFIFSSILFRPTVGAESGIQPVFALIFGLHLFTMLVILALTIVYIVDVFKNDRVEKDKKALWAIVIFMGNMIAMPIYWYLYIWKDPPVASQFSPAQLSNADSSAWTNNATASRQEEQYVPPTQPPNWRG
jgi:Ni,Fe-hydrogenase I cytochrome b subunit